jgi:hypothetical protein
VASAQRFDELSDGAERLVGGETLSAGVH